MKNNPKIMEKNRVILNNQNESVKQPNIDYEELKKKLSGRKTQIKDLRKESFYNKTDLSTEDGQNIDTISKDSLIPVPGMLIDYENSGSGDAPPASDWIAPHGPQWGP